MSDLSTSPEAPARRPFAAFLQEHRNGGLHAELSDALATAAAAALEHDKAATITLLVKLAPNKDGMTITVFDDVKVKAPQPARGAAIYFADERGNLSRRNPLQPELPLRELQAVDGAPRDITGAQEATGA